LEPGQHLVGAVVKSIASHPVFGMPFGLLVSLMIFPVSWLLIVIWYKKAR
jgi:hypothetical protein